MSTKWDISGTPGVNKWFWSLINTELGWETTDYRGLTPIVPSEQQPEMNDFGKPYVVYSAAIQATNTMYLVQEEQIAYTIYSEDQLSIRQAVNLGYNYMNRYDDAAKDLNRYLSVWGSPADKKFDYKYLRVLTATMPDASDEEGGIQSGMLIIRACYTVDSINGIRTS